MRVPVSADNPSFDYTFNVGFIRWLKSTQAERLEWQRRRNLAAKAAQKGQGERIDAWAERQREKHAEPELPIGESTWQQAGRKRNR